MHKRKVTIILAGGHAGATAYALSEALLRVANISCDIHFIGAKSALEGRKVPTYEQQALPLIGVVYHGIDAGRLQRRFSLYTIPAILKIPVGFFQAVKLVCKINPDIVLSFGGFVGFPVVLAAKLLGRKIIIHEQTIVYGRANKASEFFADKIALARKASQMFFNSAKTVITGNPVSLEILGVAEKAKLNSPPVIFITGASRGSQVINETLSSCLPRLLAKYKVIHQAGDPELEKYRLFKKNLGPLGKNYIPYGAILPGMWGKVMEEADVVVGRAGANMITELMVIKRPAILIPIPWTFADEQTKNAEMAKRFGIARIIPQDELTPVRLEIEIEAIINNYSQILTNVKDKISPDLNAAENLTNLILEFL